jgi:hypothetical protein
MQQLLRDASSRHPGIDGLRCNSELAERNDLRESDYRLMQ